MTLRRQFALICLLAGVSLAGYLFWTRPQIDPRFVRIWALKMDPEGTAYERIHLKSDGTMPGITPWMSMARGDPFPPDQRMWRVQGNQLILTIQNSPCSSDSNWKARLHYYKERLVHAINRQDPETYARSLRRFQIISVSSDLIELMEMDRAGKPAGKRELVPHESVYSH